MSEPTPESKPASAAEPARSDVYKKLHGETAKIDWRDLERLFAQGKLLYVAPGVDLIEVAAAIADDDKDRVAAWMDAGKLERMPAAVAQDYAARNPELWAVVVSPWVCVQERTPDAPHA